MIPPLLVYTHTDFADVWGIFFGQLKKHMPYVKVYVAVNKHDDRLTEYTQLIYDDSVPYTERCKKVLSEIDDAAILFLHEDMILYDSPNVDLLKKYTDYILKNYVKSIKLISVIGDFEYSPFDNTLVCNQDTRFSIQPTIVKPKTFLDILDRFHNLNIWEFERHIEVEAGHYMAKLGPEKQRGKFHNDSIVFPYVSTAIVKGKWNMREYSVELDSLFLEYGVTPFERGII